MLTGARDAFSGHDAVVEALVGLVALADLVRALRHEAERPAGPATASGPADASRDQRFVDALVGVVALAGAIERIVPPAAPRSTPASGGRGPGPGAASGWDRARFLR